MKFDAQWRAEHNIKYDMEAFRLPSHPLQSMRRLRRIRKMREVADGKFSVLVGASSGDRFPAAFWHVSLLNEEDAKEIIEKLKGWL